MTQNQRPIMARTLDDIFAQSSSITLGWRIGDPEGKLVAGLGIDPITLALTPSGECARVDIDPDSAATLRLPMLLDLLRRLSESLPGRREVFAVFEDRDKGRIIFLPAPRNANDPKKEVGV